MLNTDKLILIRYGGARKSSFNMNTAELDQAASSVLRRAREKAFYKGLPVYYTNNRELMAEYPDGRIEVAKISYNVTRNNRHSRSQRHR